MGHLTAPAFTFGCGYGPSGVALLFEARIWMNSGISSRFSDKHSEYIELPIF